MSSHAHTKTRRRLAALFSVPLAFSLIFFFVNQSAENRETRLLQVQRLSGSVTQLRAYARDAEAGERSFYLTGDPMYLAPLKQAQDSLPMLLRHALASAEAQPHFKQQTQTLIELVKKRFQEANQGVDQRQKGELSGTSLAARLALGEDTMNDIRRRAREMLQQLDSQELHILDEQQKFSTRSFAFFSAGSLLMIGVIVWLYNALLRYLYERDAANEKLKAANTYLEARIEERTRDLTHANEELQQFAYVASHDLQEPLRTITSFSQLLAMRYKGRLDEDADEFIGYIVTASRRMTDLINGLLVLVRLRKSEPAMEPVSFEDLLMQAEVSLQASIRENRAIIERSPLPSLVVDAVQFLQVLQNLISNAIKYRGEDPPRIQVEAHREATQWVFSVQDNGRGFDQQFSERIFGLFQRLDNREIDGTGMGLSISRKIVERHGGKMWATSKEGVGSTFFFSLPVALAGTSEAGRIVSSRSAVQAKIGGGR